MYFTIGFSGPAGAGVNTAGVILAELLAERGYTLWCDKEYASIIKGDNNCFFISLSNTKQVQLSRKVDLFFAFDTFAIDKNQEIYTLENVVSFKGVRSKHLNIFSLGACLQIVHIPLSEGVEMIKRYFSADKWEGNFAELAAGMEYGQQHFSSLGEMIILSEKIGESTTLMMGNQLIGEGAIKAGLEFYSAYPMTPVTSLIDTIVAHPEVVFFQGEDEIAVAMAMLGARFAGKRAMCGTSGGGFALMTESIAFSHQAEIGGVYVLWMRDWPSTGSPTFTSQGDLSFAMNASFGETSPAVLAPSTFEEAYTMMGQLLNWSDMYQHPAIFLVDKQLCEGYKTVAEKDLQQVAINRWERLETVPETDTYLRYAVTENGISPYAIPWNENTLFIATSYEHDESGATSESPKVKDALMQKRFRKRLTFSAKEFAGNVNAFEVINQQAEKFFVTWGINRYNLERLIENRPERGLIVIKIFHPFSLDILHFFRKHENQIRRLVFVEMNYEGQMERFIRQECGLTTPARDEKISHFRKYTLYPIFLEELELLLLS